MNRNVSILFAFAGVLLAAAIAHSVAEQKKTSPNDALLKAFRENVAPQASDYDGLALYFMQGFERFKTSQGSGAAYPGLPSDHGASVDQLEGFSRMAPLWAVWVASGREAAVTGNETSDVAGTFRRGLLAGTDPHAKEYWGTMHDNDQRIVEASDIALALWLLRDRLWAGFNDGQKRQVVDWLQQVNGKSIPDNNWHLFVVFVNAVLEKLASVDNREESLRHYSRMKQFYRGDGWFSDGPNDAFDYYNAWGIHYQLFWLQQVLPDWDRPFIDQARNQFVASYRFLMTPQGLPILGRSVCYRMAAPVPLILDQATSKRLDPAEARRALDAIWQYFIQHGGVIDGNITQGYCGRDPRVLDQYSGPASCLWGMRSLIAALYLPRDADFWRAGNGKLAVEQNDFTVEVKSIGWTVYGDKKSGDVAIRRRQGNKQVSLQAVSAKERVLSAISGKPNRPDNHAAKYDAALYSSKRPFCGCKE